MGCFSETLIDPNALHLRVNVSPLVKESGIQNIAQGIRNPTNDWNREFKFP